MAIAFDAVSNSGYINTPATSYSWNHTCTGSNLVLVVSVGHNAGGSGEVTGVTYNSVAMTHIAEAIQVLRSQDMWFLIAPATGTNSIVVTYNASRNIWGTAVSLTGVEQTGQPDASTTFVNTSSATIAKALTTVADNSWIVTGVIMDDNNNAPANLSPGTTDFHSGIFAGNFAQAIGHNGPVTPAGSTTETWTLAGGASADNAMVLASFSPVSSGFTAKFRKTLSQVGTGVGKRQSQ